MGVLLLSTWKSTWTSESIPTRTSTSAALFSLGPFHCSAVGIKILFAIILVGTNHHGCLAATTTVSTRSEGVLSAATATTPPPQSSIAGTTSATPPVDSHDRVVGDSHDGDGDDDDDDNHNTSCINNSVEPTTATTASTTIKEEDVLLDQYIDFLQQDFEIDQRLDQYIDFVQGDYDVDVALDHYIDYLLATTTVTRSSCSTSPSTAATAASVHVALDCLQQQQQQTAPGQTSKNTTITTTTTRNNTNNMEEITFVVQSTTATTTATSDDSRNRIIPTELDAYIDRLVTAVELDEYIDKLVASVHAASSTQQQLQEERERDHTVQQPQAEEEDEYIANMLLTTEHEEKVANHPMASKIMITATANENAVAVTTSSGESTVVPESQPEASEEEDEEVEEKIPVGVSSVSSGGDDDDDDDDLGDSNNIHLAKEEQEDSIPLDPEEPSFDSDEKVSAASEDNVGEKQPEKASTSNCELNPKKKRKQKQKAKDLLVKEEEQAPATETSVPDTNIARVSIAEVEEAPKLTPNGLYRFLLTKGRIGHVLIMFLVFWVDWIQMYLPQVADLLAFLWLKLAPAGMKRQLAPREYLPGDGRASPSSSVQQMYSGRMPVKGKQRKQLSKRADEEALAQLQRIGDIQDAKYKQVSQTFMRRHGLGSHETVEQSGDGQEEIPFESKPSKKKKQRRKKTQGEDDADGDSDVEWVLQGLSPKSGTKSPSARRSPIDPEISFDVGSRGPTLEVGFEIDLGGGGKSKESRKSTSAFNRDAITRDVLRKKTSGPRSGDRDGGSGVMGRLRAAATSNNLVSSRLLGAYPGDVVPPNEAADAAGVAGLAEKYGYGKWSDDDDDDHGYLYGRHETPGGYSGKGQARRRKRISQRNLKKRTKRRSSEEQRGFSEEGSLDVSNLFDYGEDEEDNSLMQVPNAAPTRKKRPKSSRVKQTGGTPMIRPPLDFLDETQKASRRRRKRREKANPMVSSVDALKNSNEESKRDMGKLIRPPLEKLEEAQSKLKEASDNTDDDVNK